MLNVLVEQVDRVSRSNSSTRDSAIDHAISRIIDLAIAIDRDIASAEVPELKHSFQEIYDRLPNPDDSDHFYEWREKNG